MAEKFLLVLSTFGSAEEARRVGRTLVEEHLAACVNLLPPVESIYRWKGEIETATETLALMKTTEDQYWLFEARLKELHSYEVPEIVAFRASSGLPAYLRWVDESCLPG
jgi:periplasmic divalent cation tolerance protein